MNKRNIVSSKDYAAVDTKEILILTIVLTCLFSLVITWMILS